jgi:phage-related protein
MVMSIGDIRLNVVFFQTDSGTEPVRKWLKSLSDSHKLAIGEDIKTVQFGWPLGMPLVEKIEPYLWEVRSHVHDGIARVLFTVDGQTMILLHGFIKKSRKIPQAEIATARSRLKQYQEAGA